MESLSLMLMFVDIDKSPSLVKTVVSLPYLDILTFYIFSSSNIKDLAILNIDNVLSYVSEELEPS
jgi:hypothetical protein